VRVQSLINLLKDAQDCILYMCEFRSEDKQQCWLRFYASMNEAGTMFFSPSWEKRRQGMQCERVIHNENVVTIYTRIYSIQ
jgi:Zn-finger protein